MNRHLAMLALSTSFLLGRGPLAQAGQGVKQPRPRTSPVLQNVHSAMLAKQSHFTAWRISAPKFGSTENRLLRRSDVVRVSPAKGGGHALKLASQKERLVIPKDSELWQRDPSTGFESRDFVHGTLDVNPLQDYQTLVLPQRPKEQPQRRVLHLNLLAYSEAMVDDDLVVHLGVMSQRNIRFRVGRVNDTLHLHDSTGQRLAIQAKDLVSPMEHGRLRL